MSAKTKKAEKLTSFTHNKSTYKSECNADCCMPPKPLQIFKARTRWGAAIHLPASDQSCMLTLAMPCNAVGDCCLVRGEGGLPFVSGLPHHVCAASTCPVQRLCSKP